MRSFHVMRYGRRTTPTTNELTQSICHSSSSWMSLAKRRLSTSALSNERETNKAVLQRSNTALPNHEASSSRRFSFQQPEFLELSKPQPNLRNFYVFFLLLFLFLIGSIVYSFIRMIKNVD